MPTLNPITLYEKFIHENKPIVDTVENLLRLNLVFLINPENEIRCESGYCVMNLVGLYHSWIHEKYRLEGKNKYYDDERFRFYYQTRGLLRLIGNCEVLVEMFVTKYLCTPKYDRLKWQVVFLIEILKFLLRLYSMVRSPNRMSLHESLLPEEDDFIGEANWKELRGRRTKMFMPPHPTQKLLLTGNLKDIVDKRKERLLFILGELLHISRPVLYVVCIIYFRKVSAWIPWFASLFLDIVSKYMTDRSLGQGTASMERAQLVSQEMMRRKQRFFYYLLRNPLFAIIIKPIVEWFCEKVKNIPLINVLGSHILEYLLTLQQYHFYQN